VASALHLLDPELAAALEFMPRYDQLNSGTLEVLRAMVEKAAQLQLETADASGVSVVETFAPSLEPQTAPVRLLIYRPESPGGIVPACLHIHGGGMVMGRPEMRHASLLAIARENACVLVSVDYRLAPETPFPGGLEDCYAAWLWLRRQASDLRIDPTNIAVIGESAGGGLAAALAILGRDRGDPSFVVQMLSYPMLDDRTASAAAAPKFAGEFVWSLEANRFAWSALLGGPAGGDRISCYAAPARCRELRDLPPAFIAVGALDLFLDEDLDYARRLVRAGVSVELHVYPGAFHAFDAVADASVTRVFKSDWRRALQRAFGR
jgi:triacylglycerol lipase